MSVAASLRFASPPSLLPAYVKILLSRKPRIMEGEVPSLEGALTGVRIRRAHLERYLSVCGEPAGSGVPIAFPHVLATPLHLGMLASDWFPLNLLGVVHTRNRIVQKRPLTTDDVADIYARISGEKVTERGQELRLQTEARVRGEAVWSETSTLLARGSHQRPGRASHDAAAAAAAERTGLRQESFGVSPRTVRRYARVSGDYNPIHLSHSLARLFGLKRAIAHGMWSLARCAATLGPKCFASPCTLDVVFKAPIPLASEVTLHSWSAGASTGFELRDARGIRGHLRGTISPT